MSRLTDSQICSIKATRFPDILLQNLIFRPHKIYFPLGVTAAILLGMDQIIFTQKEEKTLKVIGVEALVLFGSRAQALNGPKSDYDLAVLISSVAKKKDVYDLVYDLISAKLNQLINVDIVFLSEAPLELKNHVAKHGRVLYQANPRTFLQFKESVMNDYCDFAPLRFEFQKATLARI